ncbi:MAG TPA: ATP-binding protein, partial [Pirellulaceae bacterium]|nr:ATP-binding protein [Pirellulaceae bacterium]
LTRGLYQFYLEEARVALGPEAEDPNKPEALALAAAAESLHAKWPSQEELSGRLQEDGHPILVLWHTTNDGVMALLLGPRWLEGQWTPGFRSSLAADGVAIRLSDMSGQTVIGPQSAPPGHEAAPRLAADTHLPWNLHAISMDPAAALAPVERRRDLVFAGMATIAALILVGAYLIGRTVSRELALSRLQSDFVSSVSHEFRTPLTSICLLSEHLESGRVAGEADRKEYFAVLARESQRLRRLVEGLLNFGRMEAGAVEYRFETVDPAELVQAVSREFEQDAEARGHRIEVSTKEDTPLVRADRAALACAVWNLIDNAVKYSPECFTVWVDVERIGEFAAIRIRDHGIGIPNSEQTHIFDKFVRGEAAKLSGIRGTGVGLAMVHHIVAAHRGELQLQSKAGEGSAFSVLLPAVT